MRDIELTTYENSAARWQDLRIVNKDLALISNGDELAQHIRIYLQFIVGEWFLNTDYGIDYYKLIWIKNPDIAAISRHIRTRILSIDKIFSFIEFSANYEVTNRALNVNFIVSTEYGNIEISQPVSLGE